MAGLYTIALYLSLSVSSMAVTQTLPQVPKWHMYEVSLRASTSPSNPFIDITLTATVTPPSGEPFIIDGFYDGDGNGGQEGNVWKLRFSPSQVGVWKWTSHSNDDGLDNQSGRFQCVESGELGPIVADGRYFRRADGGPVYLVGNFLDDLAPPNEKFSHTLLSEKISEANRQNIIVRQRRFHKVNKMNIYLANKGDYGGISTTPWVGTANSNDKSRFDLARWKMYDRIISQLEDEGIIAELWFFADDSGFGDLPEADRKHLIKYGMARLSAYPNTMFVLCLEWQEGWSSSEVASHIDYGQKHNPWGRLWSVHGLTGDFSFPNESWIDFMATQPGNSIDPLGNNKHTIYNRALANKPLLVEEFGHINATNAKRLRGNLWACFCGGAAGSGTGSDLPRIRKFIEDLGVEFWNMHPDNTLTSKGFALANPGKEYVIYVATGGTFSVRLAPGTYHAEWFSPRQADGDAGPIPIGTVRGVTWNFTTPDANDWVLHIKKQTEKAAFGVRRQKQSLVRNGWLVHDGRAIWGWIQHNGWWRPGQRPNLARRSVGDPLGDVRPNRTEDFDKLTDNMLRYGYPGFEHNYGLWYDRRRDAHDTTARTDANVRPPFLEQPWARSGIGRAADGLTKYDLTKFNSWYFQRLKDFAELCDKKGTVLVHKYYMQHALLETQAHYVDFPWRPDNCIQNTGMPETIPAANAFYDISHPIRRKLHRLYIRKCLETLGDNTNVIHLTSQEYTGPLSFVQFWIDTILEWEQETGKDVVIGLGAPKDVQDAVLADPVRAKHIDVIDLRYWWIRSDGTIFAPRGGQQIPGRYLEYGKKQAQETSPEQIYRKIRQYRDRYPDKAIIDAIEADRQKHWAFFMAGGSLLVRGQISYPNFEDPLEYIKPMDVDIILPSYKFIRKHLANRIVRMRPVDIVLSNRETVWALAEPDKTYLIYALHGGEIRLDLSNARGIYTARWFNPRNGKLIFREPVASGRTVSINAPDTNDWVLWLERKTP